VPAERIVERVEAALRLVHLDGYGTRWPHQLSGGQLQRVAIARALVIEPEVLLLDEPLSNLDAKLRVEMRGEIRQLQQSLGITAIYVTHDQEEALAISDRIAVMHAGEIEQIDRPGGIYGDPASPFVAEFMGVSNLLSGTVTRRDSQRIAATVGATEFLIDASRQAPGQTVAFCLRPEALRVIAADATLPPGWCSLAARITRVEFLGALTRLETEIAGGTTLRVALLDQSHDALSMGRELTLAYDPRRATPFKSP
jgi:ABC-type Fe3+/spermidine/putrescine transport system ATPase subunit